MRGVERIISSFIGLLLNAAFWEASALWGRVLGMIFMELMAYDNGSLSAHMLETVSQNTRFSPPPPSALLPGVIISSGGMACVLQS